MEAVEDLLDIIDLRAQEGSACRGMHQLAQNHLASKHIITAVSILQRENGQQEAHLVK